MGEDSTRSPQQPIVVLLAAIVLGICLFSGLSALGFVGPDEPRYSWIARSMAETGDWITPILYGRPWFEKPILFYWAAAIGFRLLPSPEWAARLPSACAALVAALSMAWLGWRRYGAATACAVLFVFPTCLATIVFARAATPDMLFAASLALALCSAEAVLGINGALGPGPSPPTGNDKVRLVFLGAALGLATLAKGPAGILLAGGSACLWALLTRKWKAVCRLLHPLAILSFCAVALPWYVLCAYRNPHFFHAFIVLNNFERYLTPVFRHPQPFWFFGPILLLGVLPWTALLAGLCRDAGRMWRAGTWRTSSGLFLACWVAFPVLFFSFSQSKLPEYILPVFPPLALLLGRSFTRTIEESPRTAKGLGVATGILWLVVCAAGAHWLDRFPGYAPQTAEIDHLRIVLILVGAFAAVGIVGLSATRRFWAALILSSLLIAVLVEYTNRRVLPILDPYLSARALAKSLPQAHSSPLSLLAVGVNRGCAYGLRFYRPDIRLGRWPPAGGSPWPPPHSRLLLFGPQAEPGPWQSSPSRKTQFVAGYPPYCWVERVTIPADQ